MNLPSTHIPYHHDSGAMAKSAVRAIIIHDTEGHEAYDEVIFSGGDGGAISIHNYINRAGELHDSVPWSRGANHAGYGDIPGTSTNPNDCTLGIELEHHDQPDYPEAQLLMLDKLIAEMDAYLGRKVPIYGHKDIDPERKSDPNNAPWLDNYKRYRTHTGKPVTPVDTSWAYILIHGGNNTDMSHYVNDAKARGDAVSTRQVPRAAFKPEYMDKAADAAAAAVKDAK